MCYTGVIINPLKRDIHEPVVKKMMEEMRANSDGFYLFSMDPDVFVRTVEYDEFVRVLENVIRGRPKFVHFHFRLASSGSVSEENVHGWSLGKYYVTHNGYVGEYATDPYYCDTYILVNEDQAFRNLVVFNDWSGLYDYLLAKNFYGVMFVVSRNADEVYGVTVLQQLKFYHVNDITYAASSDVMERLDRIIYAGKGMIYKKYVNGIYSIRHGQITELHKGKPPILSKLFKD